MRPLVVSQHHTAVSKFSLFIVLTHTEICSLGPEGIESKERKKEQIKKSKQTEAEMKVEVSNNLSSLLVQPMMESPGLTAPGFNQRHCILTKCICTVLCRARDLYHASDGASKRANSTVCHSTL